MRFHSLLVLLVVFSGISAAQETNFPVGPQYLITTENTMLLRSIATPSLSLSGDVQNIEAVSQNLFKQYGVGKLLQATDGNLWTSTSYGGVYNYGRVFSITTSGTVLDSLSFNRADGSFAVGGLIEHGSVWLGSPPSARPAIAAAGLITC